MLKEPTMKIRPAPSAGILAALATVLRGPEKPRPKNWDRQVKAGLAPAHSQGVVDRRVAPTEAHVVAARNENIRRSALAPGHAKRCTNIKKLRRRARIAMASPEKRAEMTSNIHRRKQLAAK